MPARSLLEAYLWIVNKGTPLAAVWGEFAGGCVLETFNDGRLARSIVANDEGKGGVELNSLTHSWAEGPDTGDGELVYSRHGLQAGSQELCSILCLQETLATCGTPNGGIRGESWRCGISLAVLLSPCTGFSLSGCIQPPVPISPCLEASLRHALQAAAHALSEGWIDASSRGVR